MNFVNKNFKWISLGGNVLAFISLFLPFATVSASALGMSLNQSVAYIDGDGVLILVALLAASGLIFLKNGKFSLIPLGISLAIVLYDTINMGAKMGDVLGSYSDMVKVSLGAGFYLLLLGLIVSTACLVYGNFIMKKINKPVNNVAMNQGMQMNNQVNNAAVAPTQEVNNQQPVNPMPVQTTETVMQTQEPVVQPIMQQEPMTQEVNEPTQKFCSGCGAKQNPNSKFCEFCGSPLN